MQNLSSEALLWEDHVSNVIVDTHLIMSIKKEYSSNDTKSLMHTCLE